jgi:hypothetical protein
MKSNKCRIFTVQLSSPDSRISYLTILWKNLEIVACNILTHERLISCCSRQWSTFTSIKSKFTFKCRPPFIQQVEVIWFDYSAIWLPQRKVYKQQTKSGKKLIPMYKAMSLHSEQQQRHMSKNEGMTLHGSVFVTDDSGIQQERLLVWLSEASTKALKGNPTLMLGIEKNMNIMWLWYFSSSIPITNAWSYQPNFFQVIKL